MSSFRGLVFFYLSVMPSTRVAQTPAVAGSSVELHARAWPESDDRPQAEPAAATASSNIAVRVEPSRYVPQYQRPVRLPRARPEHRGAKPPSLPLSLHSSLVCLQPPPKVPPFKPAPAASAAAKKPAPPAAAAATAAGSVAALAPDQLALVKAILSADLGALFSPRFDQTDWNFACKVTGRTAPQSPLALLLRPELNYGNLSRITDEVQMRLVRTCINLDPKYAPRLDSYDSTMGPDFQQSMSMHVIQCVYQGKVALFEALYECSQARARNGTGKMFNLRDRFFKSQITLLHMAAHDGQTAMARWIVARWSEESFRDPPGSLLTRQFHADVEDASGQTPLFWTFARGTVSVELARFLVEDCGADFFRVFTLRSTHTRPLETFEHALATKAKLNLVKSGKSTLKLVRDPNTGAIEREWRGYRYVDKVVRLAPDDAEGVLEDEMLVQYEEVDGFCSPFSLAIELAPPFVEEQLRKKVANMGTRFQCAVFKFDFVGVTVRNEQVDAIQTAVDYIFDSRQDAPALEKNEFLKDANERLQHFLDTKVLTDEAIAAERIASASAGSFAPAASASASPMKATATAGPTHSLKASHTLELRFLSQEPQRGRKPKGGWDNFFYETGPSAPKSALELMVLHDRKKLLMTPLMQEVQKRMWMHTEYSYYAILGIYITFGLAFAVNTALWPRTALLYATNLPFPLPAGTGEMAWRGLYLLTNILCALLAGAGVLFHLKVVRDGPESWRPEPLRGGIISAQSVKAKPGGGGSDGGGTVASKPAGLQGSLTAAAAGVTAVGAFVGSGVSTLLGGASQSAKPVATWLTALALNTIHAFRHSSAQLDLIILLMFLLVEALQWALICHAPLFAGMEACAGGSSVLVEDDISALAWASSALHLLLGLKLLELAAVFEVAGPLLSSMLGMFRDVAKFLLLFGVGFFAFATAVWIVLKDVYEDVTLGLGLAGPGELATANALAGLPVPVASFTYYTSMTRVLLWVFGDFSYPAFASTPTDGVASLGRVLLLMFLLVMVLIMLNLMIAMFSNTYSNVVKDSKGEWHVRYSNLMCQLLRMAGSSSSLSRRFVCEMAVDNNCGIDRELHDSASASGSMNAEIDPTASDASGDGFAYTVESNFANVARVIAQLGDLLSEVHAKIHEVELAQAEQHRAAVDAANAGNAGLTTPNQPAAADSIEPEHPPQSPVVLPDAAAGSGDAAPQNAPQQEEETEERKESGPPAATENAYQLAPFTAVALND